MAEIFLAAIRARRLRPPQRYNMNALAILASILAIVKEAMTWGRIVAQARLEQNDELRKKKGEMLDAAKKSIDSGDTSHIIDLADQLRQPGS